MIVCSCNVFSEHEVRRALARAVRPPRVSQVYACLGYARQCGRCARTIKKIMDEDSANGLATRDAGGNVRRAATGVPLEGKPTYRAALIDPVQTG